MTTAGRMAGRYVFRSSAIRGRHGYQPWRYAKPGRCPAHSPEVIILRGDGLAADHRKTYTIDVSRKSGAVKVPMAGGICIIDRRKVMVIIGSGTTDAMALFF